MTRRKTTGERGGWLRAMFGGMAGLFSGAVLMYFTPLVDKVIKPEAPLANFSAQTQGLTVTFQNRSISPKNVQGWWEFGDGSPLEPLVPGQEFVTHTYPRPGEYTAKLILRNVLGEENERSVNLKLEQGTSSGETPKILALEAVPVTPEPYAPATFRLESKVSGAQFCVWDLDENRPLEINTDPTHKPERLVTFERPGGYIIKLAAFNGSQHDQTSTIVNVLAPPPGSLTAVLTVADEATRVDVSERPFIFADAFPHDVNGSVYRLTKSVRATPGTTITDVLVRHNNKTVQSLAGKNSVLLDVEALGLSWVRNLLLQRDADGQTVRITGDLVRPTGKNKPLPNLVLPVVLKEERRRPGSRAPVPVTASLTYPGSTKLVLPPMPTNWVTPQRQLHLQLRDGERVIWQDKVSTTRSVMLNLRNRRCVLTATPASDHVHVSLTELTSVGQR